MLALTLLACQGPPPPTPGRTVIVVVACTFRADRISIWGGPASMPHLEELAAEGLVADHALSAAPWTRPGAAAALTGRHPLVLGIDDLEARMGTTLGIHPDFLTLAERFKAEGWSTVGITANPNANKVFGFDQGFDEYIEATGLWRQDMVKVDGDDVVDLWAEAASQRGGDLYGQLLVIDTHKPRTQPPLAYLGIGDGMVEVYDYNLGILDDTLARLDAALEAMGRSDRLIVVVGDHGEGLNLPKWASHAHGRTLYDAALHVPLLFSGPGVTPGRLEGLVSTLDLVPTVAALAGLPRAPSEGRDLLHDPPPRGVLSETHFQKEIRARWSTDEWTWIYDYRIDQGALYAASDRRQARDVAGENGQIARELQQQMAQVRVELQRQARPWEGQGASDTEKAQLEALGYVED